MIENVLGAQIARFRKEAKMTQEALGAAVGVSTQAVSRWECGGLPDAALLPAIADALHVSIDALFARDASQPADLSQTIAARLAAAPEERRVLELARLFWRAGLDGLFPEKLMSFVSRNPDPLQSCQIDTASVNLDGPPLLMTTSFSSNDGLTFGICAKDMSFMSAFPEPEKGYAAYFSSCEEYRALFSALARPQLLEQLFFLCGCKAAYFTVEAVARRTNLSAEETEANLKAMYEAGLAERLNLETETEPCWVYRLRKADFVPPLMIFARLALQKEDVFYCNWNARTVPVLRAAPGTTNG